MNMSSPSATPHTQIPRQINIAHETSATPPLMTEEVVKVLFFWTLRSVWMRDLQVGECNTLVLLGITENTLLGVRRIVLSRVAKGICRGFGCLNIFTCMSLDIQDLLEWSHSPILEPGNIACCTCRLVTFAPACNAYWDARNAIRKLLIIQVSHIFLIRSSVCKDRLAYF